MLEALRNQKIAITGASGWLGKELLELLLKKFGPVWLVDSVFCFGASSRNLKLSNGIEIEVTPLSSLSLIHI